MCRALIQTVNTSDQTVAVNSVIGLGSTARRFGCNCRLNGNAVEINGDGYYTAVVSVTVAPESAGTVTVGLFLDGVQLPGAIASATATAGSQITLPIIATIRRGCCADETGSLTAVLLAGAGTVSNIAVRVEKE